MSGMKLEKITKIRLPYDGRDHPKNYGIHGLDVWFILKGPNGAVQFMISCGVYLENVRLEAHRRGDPKNDKFWFDRLGKIEGYDVGYHSKKPFFEGQHANMDCDLFDGEPCYYDGSALRADAWVKDIFSGPGMDKEERIWKLLKQEYTEYFGKK